MLAPSISPPWPRETHDTLAGAFRLKYMSPSLDEAVASGIPSPKQTPAFAHFTSTAAAPNAVGQIVSNDSMR